MAAIVADRYVDTVSGNDGNTGLSTAQAWKTVQYAADNAGANKTIAIKGNVTLAAKWDIDTSAYQWFIFVNDSWENDRTVQRTIDATATGAEGIYMNQIGVTIENFDLVGATAQGINMAAGSYQRFINFKIRSCGTYALDDRFGNPSVFADFVIDGCANGTRYSRHSLRNGSVKNASSTGLVIQGGNAGVQNVRISLCTIGINLTTGAGVYNCVIDQCTTGIQQGGGASRISYCRIVNNTTGISLPTANGQVRTERVGWYGNGTKVSVAGAGAVWRSLNDVDMASEGVIDKVGGDYGTAYGAELTGITQTIDGSSIGENAGLTILQPTVPDVGDVRDGVTYGTSGDHEGNLSLPTEDQVLSPVSFGTSGTEYTGNVTLPLANQVLSAVNFGVSATEYIGTISLPTEDQVLSAVGFGISATEYTGNVTQPDESQVESGVAYGVSGTSLNGSFVGQTTQYNVLFRTT